MFIQQGHELINQTNVRDRIFDLVLTLYCSHFTVLFNRKSDQIIPGAKDACRKSIPI